MLTRKFIVGSVATALLVAVLIWIASEERARSAYIAEMWEDDLMRQAIFLARLQRDAGAIDETLKSQINSGIVELRRKAMFYREVTGRQIRTDSGIEKLVTYEVEGVRRWRNVFKFVLC